MVSLEEDDGSSAQNILIPPNRSGFENTIEPSSSTLDVDKIQTNQESTSGNQDNQPNDVGPNDVVVPAKFKCLKCFHDFKRYSGLLCHVLAVHLGHKTNGSNICSFCNRKLKSKSGVLYHMYSMHNFMREEIQKLCPSNARDHATDETIAEATGSSSAGGGDAAAASARPTKRGGKRSTLNRGKAKKAVNVNAESGKKRIKKAMTEDRDEESVVYKCKICLKKNSSEYWILKHIGMTHHKKKILDRYSSSIDNNRRSCKKCDKKLDSEDDLVVHLSAEHKVVAKYVSKKPAAAERKSSEVKARPENIIKKEAGEGDVVQGLEGCNLCPDKFLSSQQVEEHLAKVHFRDQVSKYFGNYDGECRICPKIMLNEDCLIQHLILRHNIIKTITDGESINFKDTRMDDSSEKQKSPKISGSSVTSKKSGSVNGNGVTEPEIAKKRGRPLNKDLKKKQSRSPAKRSSSVAASSSSSLSASPATEDDLLLIDKKRRKRDGDSTSTFLGNFKCTKCNFENANYTTTICHIARSHFQERLATLLGKNILECGVCDRVFETSDDVIRHIAEQHQVADFPTERALMLTSVFA